VKRYSSKPAFYLGVNGADGISLSFNNHTSPEPASGYQARPHSSRGGQLPQLRDCPKRISSIACCLTDWRSSCYRIHAVPLVTIELGVKNGSYTEPPELNGLSHLYEHMFSKRTEPSPIRKIM